MKRLKFAMSFVVVLGFFSGEHAWGLDEDFQGWLLVTATGPSGIDPSLRWYLEAQPRIGRDFEHIERLLLRTALNYRFADHWSAWAGYGWTPTFHNARYANSFDQEHRIWTQLQRDERYETRTDSLRLRFEQRFIDGVGNVAHRFRALYRLSSNDPLLFGTKFTGYNELFLNANDTSGPRSGFDRNRFFVGPYWTEGDIRVEAGYINEFSIRKGLENRDIHALFLSVGLTL